MQIPRPSRRLRRTLLVLAPVMGAAFFLAILPASRFDVHLSVRRNTVVSAIRGSLRYYTWDAELWAIKYPRGLSVEDASPSMRPDWLPKVHLGSPSLNGGIGRGQTSISVPLWLLSAASMACWWAMRRARWHREQWECQGCGYDLRGLEAELCPECGAVRGPVR